MPLTTKPNIVILYADDLGFGDVGCYGASGIPTPNLDRLAERGMRFTEGHATAATCTPARYSLLTGSYPWRNPGAQILTGDAPLIIPPGSHTLPEMLRRVGYATGIVGKWHLGLGDGQIDWNQAIDGTPLDVGFDRSYIMAATNDRVPCVYLDGRTVVGADPADPIAVSYAAENPFAGEPTGRDNPEMLRVRHSNGHDMSIVNGVGRIGYMKGGRAALWRDEEMAEVFLAEATAFVTANRAKPFFLYYALHQPHVPRLPSPRFAGATARGARGDVIVELDWCVGQLLDTLDRLGITDNTIVLFSSDNGPVLDDGYADAAVERCGDHRPAGPLRGGKYSLYDGGNRVPFILRWPGVVRPGTSDALVCQVDLLASFAALLGIALPPDAALDSENVLAALLGQSAHGREELVTEGIGARTAIREGRWVLIPPHPGAASWDGGLTETGYDPEPQLFDFTADIGQRRNVAREQPELVSRLTERLRGIRAGSCTRAGAAAP